MEKDNNNWWDKRVLRSVDNLKLWHDNPRLDPSSKLITVRDFVEELILDPSDEQKFLSLIKSIATRGFISIDPVVIWKNEEDKFVVAEGNRRILALKLLRNPERAPLSIRKKIIDYSRLINRDDIEKVKVCLSPSYEETRWYVLQRHSPASQQSRWQRLQIQRFIINTYDSVNQDIEKTIKITGFQRSEIIQALRFVHLRDIATKPSILNQLTDFEKEQVTSHRISMTILERWFTSSRVKDAWHFEFTETGVKINADIKSFDNAYVKFLKFMLSPQDNELSFSVNTRTIDSKFDEILNALPKVQLPNEVTEPTTLPNKTHISIKTDKKPEDNGDSEKGEKISGEKDTPQKTIRVNNPNRTQLTDQYHSIETTSYKVKSLFDEFKKLPVKRYKNVTAAALRVFLELTVDQYIKNKNLKDEVAKQNKTGYSFVALKSKLKLLRGDYIVDVEANKVIDQLLHDDNDFSLNTLNEYIHGEKCYKVEPQFINRFWDKMTPLFGELISLKEI